MNFPRAYGCKFREKVYNEIDSLVIISMRKGPNVTNTTGIVLFESRLLVLVPFALCFKPSLSIKQGGPLGSQSQLRDPAAAARPVMIRRERMMMRPGRCRDS